MKAKLASVAASAALVGAALVGVFATPAADAQSDRATPVILILNQQRVIAESRAGQSMTPQLTELQEEAAKELENEVSDLKKEAEDLKKQRDLLAEDVWMKKAQQLAVKEQNLPALQEVKRQEIRLSQEKAINEINQVMRPILKDIVEKNGATLMLDRAAVMYASQETDITDEVIRQLDKKLKKIEVEKVDMAELQRQIAEQQKQAAADDGKKKKKKKR